MKHVNQNFINRLIGETKIVSNKFVDKKKVDKELQEKIDKQKKLVEENERKKKYIQAFYEEKQKPKSFILDQKEKQGLTETIMKCFGKKVSFVTEDSQSVDNAWVQKNTAAGIFYQNKITGQWMNTLGRTAQSIEELIHSMGESFISDLSDGPLKQLQIPYVAEDHTLVAFSWGSFDLSYTSSPVLGKAYIPYGVISSGNCAAQNELPPTPAEVVQWYNDNPGPMGKNALIPGFIHGAWWNIYWLELSPYLLQDCMSQEDACKDPATGEFVVGSIANRPGIGGVNNQSSSKFAGSQKFASPWLDNATNKLKPLWIEWLQQIKAAGITLDYIMGNIADTYVPNAVSYWSTISRANTDDGGDGYLTHYGHILNDPRTQSNTFGNASIYGSLYSQLKLDQGFTLSDFNVRNLADGTTQGYLLWNSITSRLGSYYINDGYMGPVSEIYPNVQASNYANYKLLESDKIPDAGGHKQYMDNQIGNAKAPVCYGEMAGAGTVYVINESDPTVLSFNPIASGSQRFGYDSNNNFSGWRCFQLDQQKLRGTYRNKASSEGLHPWIKSRRDTQNNAFGGPLTAKRDEYWAENIYHIFMFNPDIICYFNYAGGIDGPTNYDKLVADLVEEINALKNNKRATPVSTNSNKLSFAAYFLASGCKIYNENHLWRITVNYDFVETLVVNGTVYDVSTTPGIWYTTSQSVTGFNVSNYDGVTKTLMLTS